MRIPCALRHLFSVLLVASLLTGCASTVVRDDSQAPALSSAPVKGTSSVAPTENAAPVLWRILSDPYGGRVVRNVDESANITVFTDGLVALRTPEGVHGIVLSPPELRDIVQRVNQDLRPMPLDLEKPWEVFGDMPVTIIRGNVDGAEIEAAAIGVRFSELVDNPQSPSSGLTPGFVELDRILWSLVDRMSAEKSVSVTRTLPKVPIIPIRQLYPVPSPS